MFIFEIAQKLKINLYLLYLTDLFMFEALTCDVVFYGFSGIAILASCIVDTYVTYHRIESSTSFHFPRWIMH